MKKLFRNLLIFMLCLLFVGTFAACNGSDKKNDDSNKISGSSEEIYASACEKLNAGKTAEAYEMLNGIRDYAPAAEKLKGFFYLPGTVVEKSGDGNETNFYTYNSDGNVTKVNDKIYTYNANGNVISGGDLLYNDYDNPSFTYQDGKLIKITSKSRSVTYEYNEKGLVSKEINTSGSSQYISNVTYTYYVNGSVKTKTISGDYDTIVYHYNEDGKIVKYVTIGDDGEISTTITQGKYGIKEFHYQDEYGKVDFSYTYDTNGALTKLEVQMDYDGSSESIEYDFTDNQLFYSENPNVIARANIITYQDIDAALDIAF